MEAARKTCAAEASHQSFWVEEAAHAHSTGRAVAANNRTAWQQRFVDFPTQVAVQHHPSATCEQAGPVRLLLDRRGAEAADTLRRR